MKRIQLENRTELWNEIPLATPYVIFIDPSSRCNLNCDFCMNDKIKDRQDMEWQLYFKIMADLFDFPDKIKTIRLYGFGEPLVNPNFVEMARMAKKHPQVEKVDTTTNGILLNQSIVDSGIDRINVSVNEVTQDLIDRLARIHVCGKDITLFAKTIGDGMTEQEKEEWLKIFEPITDGCAIEYLMKCWYDIPMNIKQEVGVYGQPLEEVDICPYIFYSMMIHSDGIVSVCFLDWDKRMIVGDVKKNSLKEIWDGWNFRVYRKNMLRNMKPELCKNCNQLRAGMPVNLDLHKEQLLRKF